MKRTRSGCTIPTRTATWLNHQLERVDKPRAGKASETERVTDGTVSPRRNMGRPAHQAGLRIHRAADLFAGNWTDAGRLIRRRLARPRERASPSRRTAGVLTGEGGGKSQPGTFAKYACSMKSRISAEQCLPHWWPSAALLPRVLRRGPSFCFCVGPGVGNRRLRPTSSAGTGVARTAAEYRGALAGAG